MAGYLKHPHVFEQRTLYLLESQGFFWCEISPNADFFPVQNGEKLVFVEPLSCQISNNFFLIINFWGQILPQVAVGSQKYRRI
jgi:hypothetical protein